MTSALRNFSRCGLNKSSSELKAFFLSCSGLPLKEFYSLADIRPADRFVAKIDYRLS